MSIRRLAPAALATALLAALLAAAPARAQEAATPAPATSPAPPAAALTPAPPAPAEPALRLAEPTLAVKPRPSPSWWLPPLEVVGISAVISGWNRAVGGDPTFYSTLTSFKNHLNGPWWYDEDKFATNQFGHPYQGHMYFSTARSLGQGFWTSFLHAGFGSLLWEMAGELEPPSVNDQITTTVAGSFLGEILYRLSNRILDGGGGSPSAWRKLAAAAVEPIGGFNRLLYGQKYRLPAERLPLTGELALSFRYAALVRQDGTTGDPSRAWLASARAVQGFPGSGHRFDAPFDYFDITAQVGVDKEPLGRTAVGDFSIHGLLLGTQYGSGASTGLVGLYGSYDFLTPSNFRASSSALGVGTVGQVPFGDFLFQGQGIVSLGYGAGGSLTDMVGRRDYHFGLQGVLFAEAGLVWRDTLWLAFTTREYLVSSKATAERGSWEDMTFSNLDLTWRLFGPHSVKAGLGGARRKAHYPGLPDIDQKAGTLTLAYAWQLGNTLTYSNGPR